VTVGRRRDPAGPPAIVVFVENRPFFGALLVHVPLLRELRRRHPGRQVHLLAPFAEAGLLCELRAADALHRYGRGWAEVRRLLQQLRPGAVYLLRPTSLRLAALVGLCGAPERVGFRSAGGGLLLSRSVRHDVGVYRPRNYLSLLPELPAETMPLGGHFRELAAAADRTLLPRAPYVAVLPGGGAGDFKLWGVERFLQVCGAPAASERELRFLFVLGRAEAHLRAAIEAALPADRFSVLVDASVATLAAAAFGARAALGNDCGPGHVFQMCGCPYVCVMSNQDGQAAGRVAEWVDAANHPFVQESRRGEPITAIAVEQVTAALARALTLPERP
jgi:ADP-heptose:LPS heptosyltransferase